MKVNSHCWLRTALQRVQCIFIILWKYSNKHRTEAVALIRGRRLLTFRPHVRRLIEGGAYSGAALIQVNTVSLVQKEPYPETSLRQATPVAEGYYLE